MTELVKINRDYFSDVKEDFLKVAGVTEGEFLKEVGFAIQQINKTPQLQKSSRKSILAAIMNVAQIGLSLNPVSAYAYLIPRWDRNSQSVEAALEPSYKGLMKLLTDTHTVKSMEVRLVYKGEEIEIDYGHNDKVIKHIPNIFGGEKQEIVGAYSLASLADGTKHIETMSIQQVYDIREISESYKAYQSGKVKNCIWVQSEGEMIRKTVIKRHFKFLPKSDSLDKIDKAVDLDNKINGLREMIKDGSVQYALGLINTSNLEEHIKVDYETQLLSMEYEDQVIPMIKKLYDCQVDRIDAGMNYNAGDIKNKLSEVSQ